MTALDVVRAEARARNLVGGTERRAGHSVAVTGAGTRAASEGWLLTGTAAVFGREAVIAGLFREVVERGAFTGVLRGDTQALVNHDPSLLLARTRSGTLRLSQGRAGLDYEGDLDPSNPVHQAARSSLARRDMSESSFAFTVDAEEWTKGGGLPLRTIVRVSRLWDVSPVTYPAYGGTSSGVRDEAAAFEAAAMARRHARRRF